MNFKNKQAMRYGGKSNMATSYRNGGPGDDEKGTAKEKTMYGMGVSDIDAQIESYLGKPRPGTPAGDKVYDTIKTQSEYGSSLDKNTNKMVYSDATRRAYKNAEADWKKSGVTLNK